MKGEYNIDMHRFGLKFFGGSTGGKFNKVYTFTIRTGKKGPFPYNVPKECSGKSSIFEFSRYAAPNPTMLPSWNQIGFDSLHYIGGAVEGAPAKMLVWVIAGKHINGRTVIDPDMKMRFPLTMEYDKGLVTLFNYDGFKINFVGSWDMPFKLYRISTRANLSTGSILVSPALSAVTLCDEIEYYGKFLKLMGMSEFDTGEMAVFGGLNMALYGKGYVNRPGGRGKVSFSIKKTAASVEISGSTFIKKRHLYSLLLVNAETGRSFPLYYTGRTVVHADRSGHVNRITVSYKRGEVSGKVRAFFLVDTFPVKKATLKL